MLQVTCTVCLDRGIIIPVRQVSRVAFRSQRCNEGNSGNAVLFRGHGSCRFSYLISGFCRRRSFFVAKLFNAVTQRGLSSMSEDFKLKELLDYLDNLKNYEKVGVPKDAGTDSAGGFDLARMRRLMERLGDPQRKFKAIHIAGTKGKGSTAAFLSSILREDGYAVGCYTSPHIKSIRERITLGQNSDPVSSETLMTLYHEIKETLDESFNLENGRLSHFEVLTALAYTLFAKKNVDIAVVEAGLGGARDATNILSSDEVVLSVITTIAEEHVEALGGSLESIAIAKSGIIKRRCPVVIGGPLEPHIESVLRRRASLLSSRVISAHGPQAQTDMKCICLEQGSLCQICDLVIHIEDDIKLFIDLKDIKLQMIGLHQLQNAATATCAALCLREQGWGVSDDSVRGGLEKTCLPGRSQFLSGKEANALGLKGGTVLMDGAHTKVSAKCLTETIRMLHIRGPLAFIVAMARDKDHVGFAKQLLAGAQPQVVVLTEVCIGDGRFRTASVSILMNAWLEAALGLGVPVCDITQCSIQGVSLKPLRDGTVFVTSCKTESVKESLTVAYELLTTLNGNLSTFIVVTGSLHVCSL